ncbi:hypothetical protein HEQ60_04155 [Haematospirillum sp. H1815]|uniref:hypothetical protein n=1 Tax=Haematospirillum sp. H1815 TaxID=2723108 RepID=UPI00143B9B9C|nr:hypothetical protein [Haematospirillum sp. H1815]NKD76954.1 hypothetical protein [Haematospirillum sp. H1815]
MTSPVERLRTAGAPFPQPPVRREDIEAQRVQTTENIQTASADRFSGNGADSDAGSNRQTPEEVALRVQSLLARADDIQRARVQVSLARDDIGDVARDTPRTLAENSPRKAEAALARIAEAGNAIRKAADLLASAAAGSGVSVDLESTVPAESARPVSVSGTTAATPVVSEADKAAARAASALNEALGGQSRRLEIVPEPAPADITTGASEDYFPYGLPIQDSGNPAPQSPPPKTEAELGAVVAKVLKDASAGIKQGQAVLESLSNAVPPEQDTRRVYETRVRQADQALGVAAFALAQAVVQIGGGQVQPQRNTSNASGKARLDLNI